MNEEKFLEDLNKKCEKHNITLYLPKKSVVDYENSTLKVSGYFSGDTETIAVACGKPKEKYLPILIHESCHLDQYLEKCILWDNLYVGKTNTYDCMDRWIHGEEFSKKRMTDYINRCIDLEFDCEVRSVKKIKKYKIDINVEKYIQKANSYILFYNYIKQKRTWYLKGKEPYSIKEVWKKMPTKFLKDYHNNFDYIDLYEKYCFQKR